ncbi:MAG: winged helix-turn-helix domain-containing protein [Rhodanobacteraceae bacterium]
MKARSPESPLSPPSSHDVSVEAGAVRWRFGAFTIWEAQRRIERHGNAMRLGSRAFDLLLYLLKRPGELVGKDELLAAIWACLVVEDGGVRVHMSLLRKAIGKPAPDDGCKAWITTVPQCGYLFNGRVVREQPEGAQGATASSTKLFTRLPVRFTELIGREADVDKVVEASDHHRLVTIVGPGGIGKTSVAIAAAGRSRNLKPGAEVAFADLAPLISADHVVGAIARSMGLAADLPDPIDVITQPRACAFLPLAGSRCACRASTWCAWPHWPFRRRDTSLSHKRSSAPPSGCWSSEPRTPVRAFSANPTAPRWPCWHGNSMASHLQSSWLPPASASSRSRTSRSDWRNGGSRRATGPRWSGTDRSRRRWTGASHFSLTRNFARFAVCRCSAVDSAIAVRAIDMEPDAVFDALISLANKSLVSFNGNDSVAPYRMLDTTVRHGRHRPVGARVGRGRGRGDRVERRAERTFVVESVGQVTLRRFATNT